jgi:hypothetical protein
VALADRVGTGEAVVDGDTVIRGEAMVSGDGVDIGSPDWHAQMSSAMTGATHGACSFEVIERIADHANSGPAPVLVRRIFGR